MERITAKEQIGELQNNRIEGTAPEMINSTITFNGTNNILFCGENVKLRNSSIKFNASNSVIFLASSRNEYLLDASINNNSVLYLGRNSYFNGVMHIVISEETNVVIGDNCLFSFGIWLRTADPHLIYSCETKERLNFSKSIFIGDHVWIGQDAMLLKNSFIGSGSIVAAKALVAGKQIPSNTSWGGNPARQLSEGIFWEGSCVHSWTAERTKQYEKMETEDYIFSFNQQQQLIMQDVDKRLSAASDSKEKLEEAKQLFFNVDKNRFFLSGKKSVD